VNPLLVLLPVGVLILGPRVWVARVLKQFNRREEASFVTGAELARELLDHHGLQKVKVEVTDMGDHYDPNAKAVRLSRDKYDRRTLTAIATAAHEVAHAIQDATGYGPFVVRTHLAEMAQVAGQVGAAVLISVPIVSLAARQPIPPIVVGIAIFALLGSGVAVQLATLPTELDASFRRALPMLQDGHVNEAQAKAAKRILLASSLTYVASSLLAVLTIWPWLGRPLVRLGPIHAGNPGLLNAAQALDPGREGQRGGRRVGSRRKRGGAGGPAEEVIRIIAKPLIRAWFRMAMPRGPSAN
jgi:Zn-dependent membrane protease YugP